METINSHKYEEIFTVFVGYDSSVVYGILLQ